MATKKGEKKKKGYKEYMRSKLLFLSWGVKRIYNSTVCGIHVRIMEKCDLLITTHDFTLKIGLTMTSVRLQRIPVGTLNVLRNTGTRLPAFSHL